MHCERSGWEDTGRAIAEALGLSYAFVCEFEELHSPVGAGCRCGLTWCRCASWWPGQLLDSPVGAACCVVWLVWVC